MQEEDEVVRILETQEFAIDQAGTELQQEDASTNSEGNINDLFAEPSAQNILDQEISDCSDNLPDGEINNADEDISENLLAKQLTRVSSMLEFSLNCH